MIWDEGLDDGRGDQVGDPPGLRPARHRNGVARGLGVRRESAVTIHLLCLVIAAVLFAVAAIWSPPAPPKFNLMAAGLTFFALAFIFP